MIYPSSTTYPASTLFPSGPTLTGEILTDAEYTVQAIWADVASNAIQFDVTLFGDGHFFADPLIIDFSAPETETISNILSIDIDRGRDDNLDTFNMGTCTVKISDPEGRYNPNNESSPLYGQLTPMQPFRVLCELASLGQQALFTGYVRSIDYDAYSNQGVATINAADLFVYLQTVKPTFSTTTPTTTGSALSAALVGSGWAPSLSDIDTGDTLPASQSNDSAGDGFLEIMTNLLQTERGDFYVASDSTVTYVDRNSKYTSPVVSSINNIAEDATVTTDLTNVKNRAVVVKDNPDPTADVTQSWTDSVSAATYGIRDYSTITSDLFLTDAQALSLAQWLVSQRSEPGTPYRSIGVLLNALSYIDGHALLGTELGNKITVENSNLNQTIDYYFVESVRHTIVPNKHTIHYRLTPSNTVLVLDDPTTVLDYSRLGF